MMLLRYGNTAAVKLCSANFSYDSLIDCTCSKWSNLNGRRIKLSYKLESIAGVDCFLSDDNDMASLFALLESLGNNRVEVIVQSQDFSGSRRLDSIEDDIYKHSVASCVQFNGGIVESEQGLIQSSAQESVKN